MTITYPFSQIYNQSILNVRMKLFNLDGQCLLRSLALDLTVQLKLTSNL